jgi:serine/threonine protein kinase
VLSTDTVRRIALGAASATAHLHASGLLHGDLYAHNLQCDLHADGLGDCLLGDLGAASFLPPDTALSHALQRLETRAFGCLLEELLAHCPENPPELTALRNDCLQTAVASRPLFAQIVHRLSL